MRAGQRRALDPGLRLGDFISTTMVTAMLRQIMAYNRAGGWRKQKRPSRDPANVTLESGPLSSGTLAPVARYCPVAPLLRCR